MLVSQPYAGKESDPLVDGAPEVLEHESVDVRVVRLRGVWFRTNLEKSNVFMNIHRHSRKRYRTF